MATEITLDVHITSDNQAQTILKQTVGERRHKFPLIWTDSKELDAVFYFLELHEKHRETWPEEFDILKKAEEMGVYEGGTLHPKRLKVIGQALYERVFGSLEPLDSLKFSPTQNSEDTPIVQLHIFDEDSRLHSYPWELLHDKDDFLFDHPRAAIVRYVASDLPIPSIIELKNNEKPRLLIVSPRPDLKAYGNKYKQLPAEEGPLLQQLNQFEVSEEKTLSQLHQYLQVASPHIVHIDSHGDFGWLCECGRLNSLGHKSCQSCGCPQRADSHRAEGYLAFQDDKARPAWKNGNLLGKLLSKRGVQLVVLSACKSGLVSGSTVFNSAAGALIKQGVPAVMGIQFSMAAESAKVFWETFYRVLSIDGTLTRAVIEARLSLLVHEFNDSWYRPVLYLRTNPDNYEGRIFAKGRQHKNPDIPLLRAPQLRGLDDPDHFVREADLKWLQERLSDPQPSPIVALVGGPGLGKAALAYRFAGLHQTDFSDGVIILQVDKKDSHTLAREFIRQHRQPVTPYEEDARCIVRDILAQRRMLLIFVNVVSSESIRPLYDDYSRSAIIITTQNRRLPTDASLNIPENNRLELDPLSDQAAIRLLETYLKERVDHERQAAQDIIRLVENLPIALSIIGASLKHNKRKSLTDYAKQLQKGKDRLDELNLEEQGVSVRASLQLSVEWFEPEQKEFFACLGAFAQSGFPQTAVKAICASEENQAQRQLEHLQRLSLLNYANPDSHHRYKFYALVHDFAQELAEKQGLRDIAVARHARYFIDFVNSSDPYISQTAIFMAEEVDNLILAAEWLQSQPDPDYNFILGRLAPFLEEHGSWERSGKIMARFADQAKSQNRWEVAAQLRLQQARYLSLEGEWTNAREILQQSLGDISQIELPLDRQQYRALYGKAFAGILERQGDYNEAVKYLEESRRYFHKVEDRHNLAIILNSLGGVYKRQDKLEKAVNAFEESKNISQEIGDRRSLIKALNSLSSVLKTPKQIEQAIEYLQEAYKISKELGDRHSEAVIQNTLGGVLKFKGKNYYEEALEHLQQSYQISEQLGDRRSLMMVLANQGSIFLRQARLEQVDEGSVAAHQEKLDQAHDCFQRSLEWAQALHDLQSQAIALEGLGDVSQLQDRWADASGYFEKCLQCLTKLQSKRRLAEVHNKLGILYSNQESYDKALKAFNDSYRNYIECYSESGRSIYKQKLSDILNNIGECYRRKQDYGTAAKALNRSCNFLQELGNWPGLMITLYNLGDVYLQNNERREKTLAAFQNSRKLAEKLNNKSHLRKVLYSLSFAYREQNLNQTVKVLQDLCALFEELEEKGRPGLAKTLRTLGNVQKRLEHYKEAIDALERSRDILVELGNKKYFLALVLNDLGSALKDEGEYGTAIEVLEQSRGILTQLGDPKGRLALVLNTLGSVWKNQGEFAKADQAFQDSAEIDKRWGNKRHLVEVLRSWGNTLNDWAYTLRQRNFARAIDIYRRSYALFEQLDDQLELAALHFVIGMTLLYSGATIEEAKPKFRSFKN